MAVILLAGPVRAQLDPPSFIPEIPAQRGYAIWSLEEAREAFARADKDLPAEFWRRARAQGWVLAAYVSDARPLRCAGGAFHPAGLTRKGAMERVPAVSNDGSQLRFRGACPNRVLDNISFPSAAPSPAKRFEVAAGSFAPGLAIGAQLECRGLDESVVLCRVEEKIGGSVTHYFGVGKPMPWAR